jgi:hypothetical protein
LSSCFISYSTKDRKCSESLYIDLQREGVRCWFAPHDLPIGGKILNSISEAITAHEKVVLVLSRASIASGWVEDEVSKTVSEERCRNDIVLIPIMIDDAVMRTKEAWAVKLRDQRNIGDFTKWQDIDLYERALGRLLSSLSRTEK